ncbi:MULTISPECIES: fluoride efflux transporter CrcB [Nocardiopsis]|uniref:Fluoride-specific ion channel FluC n=1 Tax=Nocardiopsis sinuspersici TaxID=501010 RepID=A0A1V3C857_9ACTN|nr:MULTISPECIES: fluoride efflux transporter CrcB [Nocardiopsis]NYH53520.1 CrcB protein [Nocardiopsis sinuspersici]OOC56838.1 CrcB protein [Nocardiopsis sinuspersici]
MSWELWAAGLGGGAGAALRHLVDGAVRRMVSDRLPWGTLTVNTAGTLLLGLVFGVASATAVPPQAWALVAVGLCGALTTYSTFSHEVLALARNGRPLTAAAYAAATECCALGALGAGVLLARALPL